MHKLLAALLPVALLAASSFGPEDAGGASSRALEVDDECLHADNETCGASFRQLRGAPAGQELAGAATPLRPAPGVARAALAELGAGLGEQRGAEDTSAEGELSSLGGDQADANASLHSNIRTLYHQTSSWAGNSILKTGFRPGSPESICGSAIYFSPTAHDTDWKAVSGRGFMIEARVDLGRVKRMPKTCDRSMNGWKLKHMGYDSITLDRGGYIECRRVRHCIEYVIYDKSRVLSMKGYPYHGWKHWWSPNAKTGGDLANATVGNDVHPHVS